jgi:hypothetical protein
VGAALLRQNRFEQAEPLLQNAYEGLRERDAVSRRDPSRVKTMASIAQGLTELYEAVGKTNKAAEWRQRTTSTNAPPSP